MSGSGAANSICVIDDDELVRSAIAALLTGNGYTVCEAKDGDVALRLMERSTPGLIITDVMMPNRDGLETIIEAKRRFPSTPVMVMSGSASSAGANFLDFARKLGADAQIRKPFDPAQLLEKVRELLPLAG